MIDRMTERPFDQRFTDPPSIAVVRKLLVVLVAVHVPLACWSGYRAIVQVQRLELQSPTRVLEEGSTVRVDVVGSGRATIDVQLQMVQGARAETIGTRRVETGRSPAYDPRFRRGTLTVVLTPELLARFRPGPALLRATAIGRPQWMRTPPPTVRQVGVEIRHQSARPDADVRLRRA
jgi:hypothetical protein